MKKNMGSADRVIRIFAAFIIAALYFNLVISGTTAVLLMTAAGILFVTGVFGICPLYAAFGIRTCRNRGAIPY